MLSIMFQTASEVTNFWQQKIVKISQYLVVIMKANIWIMCNNGTKEKKTRAK